MLSLLQFNFLFKGLWIWDTILMWCFLPQYTLLLFGHCLPQYGHYFCWDTSFHKLAIIFVGDSAFHSMDNIFVGTLPSTIYTLCVLGYCLPQCTLFLLGHCLQQYWHYFCMDTAFHNIHYFCWDTAHHNMDTIFVGILLSIIWTLFWLGHFHNNIYYFGCETVFHNTLFLLGYCLPYDIHIFCWDTVFRDMDTLFAGTLPSTV